MKPESLLRSKAFRISAAICLLLLVGTWCLYKISDLPARIIRSVGRATSDETSHAANESYDFVRRIARDIGRVLQFTPQVTVNQTVIVTESRPITELAKAETLVRHELNWNHSHLHSFKSLEIQGLYTAKAGFKFGGTVDLHIDTQNKVITLTLPDPEILSVEQNKITYLKEEDGWWNKVTTADREKLLNQLHSGARQKAASGDLLVKARKNLEHDLAAINSDASWKTVVIYTKKQD